MEGEKKSVFASFFGWPDDCDFVEFFSFGAFCSTSNELLLVAKYILTMGLLMCL